MKLTAVKILFLYAGLILFSAMVCGCSSTEVKIAKKDLLQSMAEFSPPSLQMGSSHTGGRPLTPVSGTPHPPSMGYGSRENPLPFKRGLEELAAKDIQAANW